MPTNHDHSVRVVALANLEAMCKYVSNSAGVFTIGKISRSRIHVEYTYHSWSSGTLIATVIFPCYPSPYNGDDKNPRIVLDPMRVVGDPHDILADFWKPLLACPVLNPQLAERKHFPRCTANDEGQSWCIAGHPGVNEFPTTDEWRPNN
jgi:hypothetical protein